MHSCSTEEGRENQEKVNQNQDSAANFFGRNGRLFSAGYENKPGERDKNVENVKFSDIFFDAGHWDYSGSDRGHVIDNFHDTDG